VGNSGTSAEQAASAPGIPAGTVKSRVHHALRIVRTNLPNSSVAEAGTS
jgi:DNA-directed RNA polymerase specialized sigma24 family protein